MPIWLQVFYLILGVTLVPTAGWVLVQVIGLRVRIAVMEGEIEAIKQRCSERLEWLREMDGTLRRVDENLVCLGAKLNVDLRSQG